jgi:UDP-N-acetylglucosamine:LPS N-acetylglucosamine transferase
MIEENLLTPERLIADVKALLTDVARVKKIAAAARALAHPEAAEEIADMAAKLAGVGG